MLTYRTIWCSPFSLWRRKVFCRPTEKSEKQVFLHKSDSQLMTHKDTSSPSQWGMTQEETLKPANSSWWVNYRIFLSVFCFSSRCPEMSWSSSAWRGGISDRTSITGECKCEDNPVKVKLVTNPERRGYPVTTNSNISRFFHDSEDFWIPKRTILIM